MLTKIAIIKRLPNGKYRLYSKKKDKSGKRKNLGTFDSLSAAKKHEGQVQWFKAHSDDGMADDHETKTLKRLSDIATYLEEAGHIKAADKVFMAMGAIDGSLDEEDNLIDMFVNTDNQMNVGGSRGEPGPYSGEAQDAPNLLSMDVPTLVTAKTIKMLLKIANDLDQKGLYEEADAIDDILEIINKLEQSRATKSTEKVEPGKKEKQDEEVAARSNGKDGNSVIDNQNCGLFQGLSDAYMYHTYGDLEGAYGPQ